MREIWLQKCVQYYVERKRHLHQYSQGKFGYLYPLLGKREGVVNYPDWSIIIARCEFRDELRENRFELLKDLVRFFKEYMPRYGYKHLCTEDDDYKYYQTLNLPCIKRGFMGYHCNYGAPLKDVDV